MGKLIVVGVALVGAALLASPAAAEVNVNINVGPPPVIFSAPPRVVVVPRTPVYYAPDTSYNVFVYGGRYFSFHEGNWFLAASHGGPWAFVPVEQVPRPLLAVPVRYYKIPPGHLKKMHRDHCPPGQAKKGRC
jgi:hypothetical protein